MKPRAKFPGFGIYAVRGGLASTHYLCEADRKKFRYAAPARLHPPTAHVADCWIVDRHGQINPGTVASPVPVRREVLGRLVAPVLFPT
jgi:hypothetical protein